MSKSLQLLCIIKSALIASLLSSFVFAESEEAFPGARWNDQSYEAAIRPIGPMNGAFVGKSKAGDLVIDFDQNPGVFRIALAGVAFSEVITAEFTRRGRLIKIGGVECLRQKSERHFILLRNGCTALRLGASFELLKQPDGLALRTGRETIRLAPAP